VLHAMVQVESTREIHSYMIDFIDSMFIKWQGLMNHKGNMSNK
jgi:hypothetical protein